MAGESLESRPPARRRAPRLTARLPRSPLPATVTHAAAPTRHRTSRLPIALRAMRPLQWTKNGILLAALVFDQRLFELDPLARALAAVVVFCGLSSGVYLINDVRDTASDRQHPVKRHRAVASGALSPAAALWLAAGLLAGSLLAALFVRPEFLVVAAAYVGLMVCYSLWLKRLVLVDVLAIAAGFVIRAAAGAVAIGVEISPWLLVCTMLLALLLGFGKRRHELLTLRGRAVRHRANLGAYTARLLDQLIGMSAAATVIAYAIYTFDAASVPRNHTMMLTIPIVIYAIFRYLHLVYVHRLGGSPEVLLVRDRPLLTAILVWGVGSVVILYIWA